MPPCPSCGSPLDPDAAYCSRCGSRVELGSVLGVGTDLPPVASRDPEPPRDHAPSRDREPSHLGSTAELPRVGPVGPSPSPHPTPMSPGSPSHSPRSILAMVATFVVLTVAGTFALVRITGSPEPVAPASTASGSASTPPGEGEGAPGAVSPGPGSPSASPTGSAGSQPSGAVPAAATRCSTSGDDAVATAWAGTDRTSCGFAAAVRTAYRKAGTPSGPTDLRAFSPVTGKWYSLSCDGGEPVRCTATTGAVVLLSAS